ncbi:MAG: hypothetical protein A3B65_05860 [Acidobacteria bacterium RIFCSPHIGHO2_02_FULL_67_57]|nr:MAG: hypothetical protein A3B65_05860 [Acidobacteria bacterium RIFCSPHIGHO2_02_FULL_67_57]
MKNGRFSGKKTSKRWFTVTCGSSDSTWLKSGFTATSSTRLSRKTNLASKPASGSACSRSNCGRSGSRSSGARKERKTPKGMSWMLRPGEMFSRPSSVAV